MKRLDNYTSIVKCIFFHIFPFLFSFVYFSPLAINKDLNAFFYSHWLVYENLMTPISHPIRLRSSQMLPACLFILFYFTFILFYVLIPFTWKKMLHKLLWKVLKKHIPGCMSTPKTSLTRLCNANAKILRPWFHKAWATRYDCREW